MINEKRSCSPSHVSGQPFPSTSTIGPQYSTSPLRLPRHFSSNLVEHSLCISPSSTSIPLQLWTLHPLSPLSRSILSAGDTSTFTCLSNHVTLYTTVTSKTDSPPSRTWAYSPRGILRLHRHLIPSAYQISPSLTSVHIGTSAFSLNDSALPWHQTFIVHRKPLCRDFSPTPSRLYTPSFIFGALGPKPLCRPPFGCGGKSLADPADLHLKRQFSISSPQHLSPRSYRPFNEIRGRWRYEFTFLSASRISSRNPFVIATTPKLYPSKSSFKSLI